MDAGTWSTCDLGARGYQTHDLAVVSCYHFLVGVYTVFVLECVDL